MTSSSSIPRLPLDIVKRTAGLLAICLLTGTALADSFTYDNSGRLLSASQGNGLDHSYTYDGEANMLSGLSDGAKGSNGISEWWQNYYFNATGINPLASAAGDGVSNLTKFALGQNPLTPGSGPLVSVSQSVFPDEHTYLQFTYTRSKENAALTYLEQSSDQVMWQSGGSYFAQVGTATDLGNGTESVTYRSLTALPGANSLFFRLTTNGGNPSLVASNNISTATGTAAMPWWAYAIVILLLPLLAGRFLNTKPARNAVLTLAIGLGTLNFASAEVGPGWYAADDVVPPEPQSPGSKVIAGQNDSLGNFEIVLDSLVSGPAATAVTPELDALADGLNNDPLAIFNYVRNKIAYQPYYGSNKGAHTTYLDAGGNDMDQASLLIALLNAAGVSNTSYVYGKISVRNTATDGNDLSHWFVADAAVVDNIIVSAGIPNLSGVNFGPYILWTFDHVWVRAVIGGTTYDLDPSYKTSTLFTGIDSKTISGYSRSQLLTDAAGTATSGAASDPAYVTGVNRAAVESRLGQYASTLRTYIKTNLPNATSEEIVGGGRIAESSASSLTAAAAVLTGFSPTVTTTFTTIPSQYQATLRVQIGTQIDSTFTADSLQGNRISLVFSGLNAQLWQGDTMVAAETNGSGANANVILSIAHPYTTPNQNLGTVTYKRTGTYDLSYAFYPNGASDGQIRASELKLAAYEASGLGDSSRQVMTEMLHGLGLKWARRVALVTSFVSRGQGCQAWADHIFGRTGQEGGYYVDMPGCFFEVFNNSGFQTNTFKAIGYAVSAMEHGVIEQTGGPAALSTVKCLALANDQGQRIYRATPSNWSNISGQLLNSTGNDITLIGGYATTSGNVLLLHRDLKTAVNSSIPNSWKGFGFASMSSNRFDMRISGGYSGGFASVEGLIGLFYNGFVEQFTIPFNVPPALSAEPVDLATGAYTMTANDLVLGQANTPRGLTLSRSYDSSRNAQATSLGNGWRNSCDGKITIGSDLDASFAFRQPTDAAQTIVSSIAISDFMDASYTAKEMLVGALSANWMVNRVTNNAANVQIGEQRLTYISLPDGSWNAPPGSTTALTGSSGTFVLQPRFGGSVIFDALNRVSQWKDVDNNTQTWAYDGGGRISTVTDSQGRVLTFSYFASGNPLIQSVTDGTGRTVTYSYTGGNLTGIQDPEGFNTTLVYDSNNRLKDWKDHSGGYISRNTYDAQGRVIEQLSQGVSGRLWKFFYSPGVTQEVDPLNNVTTNYFDSKYRRVGVRDALGNLSTTAYDGQNHVVKTVDGSGRQSTFLYDGNQNLTESTDNAGKITARTYDGSLRLWKITDPTSRVTEFGYDSENHLTSIKDPGGRVTTIEYSADGKLQKTTNPAGDETTVTTYDSWANPTGVTRGDGSTTTSVFNARGDLTSVTDGRGKTSGFSYDKRRLLRSRTDPLGHTSNWTYDSNRNPASSVDRNSKTTTTVFNNIGLLQSVAAPNTGTVAIGYDLRDLRTTISDGLGHTTTAVYDPAKREIGTTDALSISVVQNILDGAGRISEKKNGLNQTSQFIYDAVGRLSYSLDPLNRRIDKTYDFAGRETTMKNRRNKTFATGYGSDGQPASFTFPSGRQSQILGRDAAGRPETLQEPSGQETTLTYDGMGRIKTQSDGVGTITNVYDGEGNLTSVTQGLGTTITRGYDDNGRLTSCHDAASNTTVSYSYDDEGNLKTITYPGLKTVTYTYDGSNRMKTVTDWAGRVTTYTYDNAGRLTQTDRPNGTRQRLEYDNADRLTATYEEKGATSIWNSTYGYDNTYRMTSSTPSPATRTLAPPPATMGYDGDNRLTSYNGASVSTDEDGNLLAAPVNGTLLGALAWDVRNRLTSAGGVVYNHDIENRRKSSTIGGGTTTYIWDRTRTTGLDRLLERTMPGGNVTRYVYGIGLIYEETTSINGQPAFTSTYHYNWQGSTMALSDGSGNVTARLSYSPYGERTVVSGNVNTPFCFNGQFGVMTESNGLLCMQARFYSPILRRFLNQDPSGFSGGINLYAYTGGDPINLVDPFGLGPAQFGFLQGLRSVWNTAMNLVPGQAAWQRSVADFGNGNIGGGSWNLGLMFAEQVLTVLTFGEGSVLLNGGRTVSVTVTQQVGPRALTQADLGITGTLFELRGTFSIGGGVARVRIDMISGDISNPFAVIRSLSLTAKAQGATTLRIESTLANERLYNILRQRYDLVTEGSNDIITIQLK